MNIDAKLSVPQAEFLKRDSDSLLIFQAGVGSGKTFVASIYLIKNMLEGHRLVAGALNHQALMKTLFRQTFDLAWKWGLHPELNKQDKTLKIGKGITFGYSNDAPDSVLGLSDIYALILDEASRCSELFYNNLSDRLRGEVIDEPFKRLITSPNNEPSAEWYNNLKKSHPEAVIRAPLYSNPFISIKYIHELEERYGIGSKLYIQQVLGKDVEGDFLNAIVKDCDFADGSRFSMTHAETYVGMDLAGLGRDQTVLYVVNPTGIVHCMENDKGDTGTHESMLTEAYDSYNCRAGALDATGGYGNGVYDAVKHRPRMNIRPINFSETPEKDIYLNIRSEMYMELAQAIKDGFYVDRERYPKLAEELKHTKAFIGENGKLRIIPKEMIKKEIGHSPDHTDALALAVYSMNHASTYNAFNAMHTLKTLNNLGYL